MGKQRPANAPKETRVCKLGEVSLGFNKKIAQEEARRCPQCAVATCLPGCPLGIDIPAFIRLLREGDTAASLERIKKANPFPAICGRVCTAPCETACVFNADGTSISIRGLERYAADVGVLKNEKASPAGTTGKKVAVIGSGPAGMTAAYVMARAGLAVTMFEAAHEPGGMLRYGIPEFRLPQKVLDEQFQQLKALGVEVLTDMVFGRTLALDEILMRGFHGVLLCVGASLPQLSGLPGSSLAGVYYDVEFLTRLQAQSKAQAMAAAHTQKITVPKTIVIGGGYGAFDAARLSLRLGSQVQILIDGFEEQAGVSHEVLEETKEEGVEIHSMQPLEIIGNGFAEGVKCRKMDIVEGKQGLALMPSTEEPVILQAQAVILANGHRPSHFLKQHLPQLRWDQDGSLWADDATGMTSIESVFACGDIVTGAGSVVDAMAGGKTAAEKIIQYLNSAILK